MHGGNLALVLLRVQGDSTFWIGMVRFELTTYRLPDDCANQTALHPDRAPARFDPSEGRCERKRSRVGRASRPCLATDEGRCERKRSRGRSGITTMPSRTPIGGPNEGIWQRSNRPPHFSQVPDQGFEPQLIGSGPIVLPIKLIWIAGAGIEPT
jgi:hypothetical protein